MTFFSSSLFFIILVFTLTFAVIAAQTTILSPSCGIDPSDSNRNILEITGNNYGSSIFNIDDASVNNCHIYIHDLVVASINFTSPIINNSNITIRNVTSSNKLIATFILFSDAITDFAFINISNVVHSSLSIDTTSGNDVISLVKFDGTITGKSDKTSWINISGLRMNDVFCDRTEVDSTGCIASTVFFGSEIAYVVWLKISSFDMKNVAMNSSSSDASFAASVHFNNAITAIQNLSISKVVLRNVQVVNNIGPSQSTLFNFGSTVDAGPSQETVTTTTTAEFEIFDIVAENATSFSGQGNSDVRLLSINGAVSNYTKIRFSEISVGSWSAISASGRSNVMIFRFGSSITAPTTDDALTTLLLDDVQVDAASSSGTLVAQIVFFVASAVTDFHTIQMRKLSVTSVNATSADAGSAVHLLYFTSSVAAPMPSLASSSLLLLDDIRVERASSTGKLSSELYVFSVQYGVDNFYSIRFTNLSSTNLNSTSLAKGSKLCFLCFFSAITAPIIVSPTSSFSPPSSLLFLDNIRFENVSSMGKIDETEATVFSVFDEILNFGSVQFSRIAALSVHSNSELAGSSVLLLTVGSSITAPAMVSSTSSSPSSFVLDSIRLENASSYGDGICLVWFLSVGGALTDYSHVQFKNLSAKSLNAVSSTEYSQLQVLEFGSSITAPDVVDAGPSSSLVIDGVLVQNASSIGKTWTPLYFAHVRGRVSGYNSIQITNLTGTSLKCTSSTQIAYIYFLAFDSPVEAPNAASLSIYSSLIIISNIRIRNVVCDGYTSSNLVLMSVVGTLRNYFTIAITNFSSSNILTTSPGAITTTCAVCLGGLSNCDTFKLENIEMKNISALTTSTSSPSTIALLSIASGTHDNISKIALRKSKIEQVSIASGYKGLVRLFDAGSGMHVEEIIINNNSLQLSSFPANLNVAMKSKPPIVSVSILGIALTIPGFLKMEVSNNILSVQDQTWQEICSPANCSIVRISDVRERTGINNPSVSILAIIGNEISLITSSFISFANYYYDMDMNAPLLNLVLEDNKARDFSSNSIALSSSLFLGFDAPPDSSSSLSFPYLVFVDVKCNQWSRAVDRAYEQQLLSVASSFSELHDFINWTCHSASRSDTASQSSLATSSSSESPTITSSSSASFSFIRTSVSPMYSDSKSYDISASRSLSQMKTRSNTADASMSISSSSSRSPIVPPPPYRSPLRFIYQTATTTTSLLSILSVSSASVFTAVRSRSALRHFNAVLYGNCGLDEESLSSQEGEPADVSSSPTTMKLSDGGYLSGLVIGNFLVILCIGSVWFVAHLIIIPKRKEDASENKQDKKNMHKNEEKETFVERMIASDAHQMMVLFTILLLEPTLTASATSFVGGMIVEGRSFTTFSVVCVFVAWFLVLVVGLIVPMWKLVYCRTSRYDEFEESKDEQESSCCNKLPVRRFIKWMTDPSGEWIFVGEKKKGKTKKTKKEKIRFELAVPFLEAFTPTFPKFIAIDLGIIICLSLAEIIGYIIAPSEGNPACFVRGTVACFAFSIHLLCVIYYRPLYSDRVSNTLAPVVEILSIVMIAGAMSINQNDASEIDGWSSVAVAQSMMESLLMVLEVAAVMLPMWDWILKKMNLGEEKSSDVGLPDIMIDPDEEEKPRDVVMDERNRKNEARCKMLDQELELLEESLLPKRETTKLEKTKISGNSSHKKGRKKRLNSQLQHVDV